MKLEEFIDKCEAGYVYSFSREDATLATGMNGHHLSVALNRVVKSKRILSLRKGYYLILPLVYRDKEYLPIELFIDAFFRYLQKKYYLAMYSAAIRHGASHQALMRDYVVLTYPPIRDIEKGNLKISFLSTTQWPEKNIQELRSNTGYYKVSSPALTIADLLHYQNKIGGYNRVFSTIEELVEALTLHDLKDLCSWYPYKTVLQRLGYLLWYLKVDKALVEFMRVHLSTLDIYPVLLVDKADENPGKIIAPWSVDANVNLEGDQ